MPAEDRYARPLAYEPGRLVRHGDLEEPIRVGTMLWVFTDPHRGHEFAYNRWYERDHYYAGCMIGANTFAASRWVATRRHKDARLPSAPREIDMPFGRLDGSYACLYFVLDGCHDEWAAWSTPQVHFLYAADRGFAPRTHYNTGFFRHQWRAYRDADPITVELAQDHRYPGMVATFIEPHPGVSDADLDAWFDQSLPAWISGSATASISLWTSIPLLDDKPDFVPTDPKADRKRLLIQFVEGDPLDTWDQQQRLATELETAGKATVSMAAPFVATVVGTDRYVDQLW